MTAFIFGILFIVMVYFYDKSHTEKKEKEELQRENKYQKERMKYQLKESERLVRTIEIINSIKKIEGNNIFEINERFKDFFYRNGYVWPEDKVDCIATIIKLGNPQKYDRIIITEKGGGYSDLEIQMNMGIDSKKLVFDFLSDYSNEEILQRYKETKIALESK